MADLWELEGAAEAASHMEDVASRMLNPEPGFQVLLHDLERREAQRFASFGGRYVRTGALRASLTDPGAEGALREAHGQEAQFGTTIPYAVFNRAVLADLDGKLAADILMAHIMGRA